MNRGSHLRETIVAPATISLSSQNIRVTKSNWNRVCSWYPIKKLFAPVEVLLTLCAKRFNFVQTLDLARYRAPMDQAVVETAWSFSNTAHSDLASALALNILFAIIASIGYSSKCASYCWKFMHKIFFSPVNVCTFTHYYRNRTALEQPLCIRSSCITHRRCSISSDSIGQSFSQHSIFTNSSWYTSKSYYDAWFHGSTPFATCLLFQKGRRKRF